MAIVSCGLNRKRDSEMFEFQLTFNVILAPLFSHLRIKDSLKDCVRLDKGKREGGVQAHNCKDVAKQSSLFPNTCMHF
jgi:hypothetical protein